MKKFLLIITILLITLSSCATQELYTQHRKKQSLMILKNTDMRKNQKYNQKSYQRHVKQNRIKNHYKH